MDKPDEPRQKFPHLIKSLFPRSRSLRSKGRSSLSSSSTIPTITGGVASDQGDISSSSASIATTAGQSTKTTVQSGEPPHNGCEDDSADEDGSVPGRNLRTIFGHDTRGLRIVYDPRSRGLEPVVDIVLIHGLGGDSYRTWRHKPDIFWPIDFLPQDLPEARVMTFGYDADAFKFFDDPVSQGSVHDHALSFIAEYSALRSQLRQEVRRDVIIIAHSLGGLVAKRAISISAQSAEISLRLLDASLSGIVFLGTPHQGSELADYADLAGKIFRLVPFNRRAINKRVLGVLRPNSEVLKELQWSFFQWLRKNDARVSVVCFYEEFPTPQAGMIVPSTSASLDGYLSLAIPATHAKMQKFDSPESHGYRLFIGQLRPWYGRYQEAQRASQSVGNKLASDRGRREEWRSNYGRALSFAGMDSRFSSMTEPISSTCEWLLQNEIFTRWLQGGHGILWILGHPGTGKSTLMKHAVQKCRDQLYTSSGMQTVSLSFFFYNLGSPLQRSPRGLLRSLLHQLLRYFPGSMDDLVDEFQYRSENTDDGGLWETEELMRHVESTITKVCQCSNVRLFVDALDECNTEIDAEDTNQDIRYLIRRLEALEENLRDAPYKFSACLACRHYPNIARPAVDHVIVAEKGNQEDIGKYLRRVLDQELDENGSKLKGQLQEFVSKEANGNFQWVKLVTAQAALMYNDGDNHVRILSEVQKLPKTLSRMYEATVTSLVARRGAMSLKLFRWVSFARWPLTLSELRRALNMTADLSSTLPDYDVDSPDYVENDTQMRKLVSVLSGGLVEIRNTSEVRADTLFLIHQSVKDYLMASGFQLLCPEIQSSHDALISGHSLLLESCLQSLSGSTFGSVEGTTSLPREVVLSTTTALASSFRTTKILRALSQNSSSLESLLKPKILSDKRVARDKNDIQNILNTLTPSTRREIRDLLCGYTMSRGSSESDLVLLYFFCICHLDPEKKALDRYSSSFWIEHALELSQNEAGADVEKLMAKFGSRTSQAQWMHLHFKGSLIHERKCIQDPTILRTLIHAYHLKEISFNDGIAFAKSTPLTIASAAGYLESVKILLSDALVSVNEQEIMTGMSPLHWAARNGHTLIVEELLRRGADVDNQDGSHKTPLLHAVEKNENATAELLLEHGARVDIKSDAQDTPMVHAIRLNRHRICAVMLERQSLDHDSSNAVWNAIRNACGSGDVGVLRTIFESGFGWKLEERLDSSQYPGYFHRSLLEAAIRKDRSQILNHLDIKRYAELHPQRTMHLLFETARALAADCLSLLVSKHGYKVNSRDEMGNTLFHTAMNSSYAGSGFHSPGFRRYLEVVFSLDLFNEELILNCPNALGVSPLQRILYADGDLDFVYFMLSYPQLDINWTGTRGSALFVAIETGNFACAERLLADPQIDPNIGTPQGQGKSNFIACLARRDMAWTELILRHKDLKITANDKELVMNEPYWSVYIPNLSELALSEAARSDLQELRDLIPKLSDISSSSSEKSNADG